MTRVVHMTALMSLVCFGQALGQVHIFVDQVHGVNAAQVSGLAGDPFKSITYALLVAEDRTYSKPWTVHVGPGIYDANPEKPLPDREFFPIVFHSGMALVGEGSSAAILSGAHSPDSDDPLVMAVDCQDIRIENLFLQDMSAPDNSGGGAHLARSTGTLQRVTLARNTARYGGGLWATLPEEGELVIDGCVFLDNRLRTLSYSQGAGMRVFSDFRGSISNCVFSGNASTSSLTVGGAISIQGHLDGQIAQNVFSSNRSDSGGAIHLAAADNADAERGVIANNIFFGDHTPGAVTSGALHTEQAVSVLNNTFYGNDTDSHLSVPVSSAACIVRNNIFGNAQNAITQANETPVFPIDHNCFFDVTNILWRDGEGLGTDLYFVGLIVNEFENNIVSAPGFIGLAPAAGTFTVAPAYDANRGVTIANVSGVSWETNQWEGAYVNFGTVEEPVLFPLLGNDASTLVLRGNLIPTGLCEAGEEFRIVDLRLRSDSVLIDAGAKVPLARDREGDVRPQSGAYDIGADEYFTGEAFHSADTDRDGVVALSELLRIIQLFHREQYRCAAAEGTEDGYTLLPVASRACAPHSADYIRQDWSIGFRELLRVVQIYNAAGYSCCTGGEEGDGFCVEQARLEQSPAVKQEAPPRRWP